MANRLQELREARGIKQLTLAKDLGVKQSTVSGWEHDRRQMDHQTLVKLAEYFDVSIDYILKRDEAAPENEKAPDTAEAVSEAKEFSVEEATQLLVDMGLIRKGQQISDDDLAFLSGVFSILTAWFRKGEQDRGK